MQKTACSCFQRQCSHYTRAVMFLLFFATIKKNIIQLFEQHDIIYNLIFGTHCDEIQNM